MYAYNIPTRSRLCERDTTKGRDCSCRAYQIPIGAADLGALHLVEWESRIWSAVAWKH